MTTIDTLPDVPSDLILLAVADNEKIAADPRYRVDMSLWHQTGPTSCHVCFAGAVMALELGADISCVVYPYDFPSRVDKKLRALDSFRQGDVESGLDNLCIERPVGCPDYAPITWYPESPERFRSDMRAVAAMLKTFGL